MKKENKEKDITEYYIDLFRNNIELIKYAKRISKEQYGNLSRFFDLDFLENFYKQQITLIKEVKNMAEKQTARKNNWEQKYNNLVKAYVELYFPLCTCFINEIIPRIDKAQFDLMCSKYSLDVELVLALISKLGKKLGSANENRQENSKTKEQRNEDSENEDINPDYKVGYKHPPKHTRFQKGDKGNPKGRKSKKGKSAHDLLSEELDKKITIQKDGKPKSMYKRDVIAKNIVHQLSTGKPVPKNNIDLYLSISEYERKKKFFDNY